MNFDVNAGKVVWKWNTVDHGVRYQAHIGDYMLVAMPVPGMPKPYYFGGRVRTTYEAEVWLRGERVYHRPKCGGPDTAKRWAKAYAMKMAKKEAAK